MEKLFIRGVSHDRSKNDSNVDYIYFNQYESEGLRQYTHKYFLGYVPLYLQEHNHEELEHLYKESLRPDISEIEIARLQDRSKDIFYGQRKKMVERA